ncbi:ead/Ea22-like family protein [Salmonella enterica]|nr:ead/Ea22-like family protein [Salmonella enterica]
MTIDKQALRISELEELNELLREKVKKLESDLWDKEQLRKVYSEKSFNLDSKVRELEARNQKDFVWRGNEISRLNDEVDELKEKLEAAERSMAEQSAIVAAAEKLVRCKGRYHSELNYRALAKLFGVVTPDLPPLEHENVHYADAAEVEITALRQRIQELEAREVTLPAEKFCPSEYAGSQYWEETEVWNKAISACAVAVRAAGIKVKES